MGGRNLVTSGPPNLEAVSYMQKLGIDFDPLREEIPSF